MNKLIACCCVLCLLVLSGCSEKNPFDTVKVKGNVLVDGAPLKEISVIFSPVAGDQSASGLTDATGAFVLTVAGAPYGTGAMAGEYNVLFSKLEMVSQGEGQVSKPKHIVPEKYGNAKTSGIASVKVEKGGKNEFNFELSTAE